MPDLTGGLKNLISKARAAKRAASVISLPPSSPGSSVVPNSVDLVEYWESTSVSSSIYSPAGSARTSPCGSSEHVGSYEAAFHASWLSEIISSPYENSAPIVQRASTSSASLRARKSDESLTLQGNESKHRQCSASHPTLDSRSRSSLYHSQGRQSISSWAGRTFHEAYKGESRPPPGEADSYSEEEKVVEEVMQDIGRIKEQGCRLLNAEELVSQASIADEVAAQGLKEVKRANRLVRINNPFVTTGSAIEQEVDHLETKQAIRERHDVGRAAKWQGWKDNRVHTLASVPLHRGATAQDVLDRARFQFEEDSEDEDLEDIIDHNLVELLKALQLLKETALASDAKLSWQQGIVGHTKDMVDTMNEKTSKPRGTQ